MRIAHFTRDFPPLATGGLSTAVAGLTAALERCGHECLVISFDGWRPRSAPGSASGSGGGLGEPERTEGGSAVLRFSGPQALDAVGHAVRQWAPSHLHVHDALLWSAMRDAKRGLAAVTVYTAHVVHAHMQSLRAVSSVTMSMAAEREALTEADLVTAPSDAAAAAVAAILEIARNDLATRLHRRAARIVVAQLGVQDSAAARAATAATAATAAGRAVAVMVTPKVPAELPPTAPPPSGSVLTLGRFGDVKGTSEWIAAIAEIARRRPGTKFVVAGGLPHNPRGDRRWRRRFEALEADVALPGWLDAEARAAALTEAAVLVLPSWFETFGLAPLEASLFATPVVSTRCGGPEQYLRDGETASFCPPRDPAALADCVLAVLDDPRRAADRAAAAATAARRGWTWEHRVESWIDAYGHAG